MQRFRYGPGASSYRANHQLQGVSALSVALSVWHIPGTEHMGPAERKLTPPPHFPPTRPALRDTHAPASPPPPHTLRLYIAAGPLDPGFSEHVSTLPHAPGGGNPKERKPASPGHTHSAGGEAAATPGHPALPPTSQSAQL